MTAELPSVPTIGEAIDQCILDHWKAAGLEDQYLAAKAGGPETLLAFDNANTITMPVFIALTEAAHKLVVQKQEEHNAAKEARQPKKEPVAASSNPRTFPVISADKWIAEGKGIVQLMDAWDKNHAVESQATLHLVSTMRSSVHIRITHIRLSID
jgi:hypothetical protein